MPEILPGIHWIKMPITVEGSTLAHINTYLIEGKNGLTLVDTGWNTDLSFSTLHNYLVKMGAGFGDIRQIIVTHVHPDHYGMAGRIKKLSGAVLAMHHIEKGFIEPRYIAMEELLAQTDRMLLECGVPRSVADSLRDATLGLEQYITPVMPDITLRDGESINTGKFSFRVIWTPGHSSGHVCLYEPVRKIFLSGDHILPKITPNVSIHPLSIENPLGRYLASLEEIKRLDIRLVLPGHDSPFTEINRRIDEIILHHDTRNAEILRALSSGRKTPYEIAQEISWAENHGWEELPPFHKRMAIFETLAHLEMMASENRVDRLPRGGISYYARKRKGGKNQPS
ncbi:MAG: MBL fold metallo-hydrolase [Dehalococcoidales bacterium]|nr:MBL fold metallo-hydrolase [Dehalococcoidales bacterium]